MHMESMGWKARGRLFAQRFWQPTSACMTCMPGSLARLASPEHWSIALQVGLATGLLVVAITFTPAAKVFRSRYGNASIVALLTMLGDAYTHGRHDGIRWTEVLLTGVTSGLLALVASFILEDRARRVRVAWAVVANLF
jgi:hypothetical protein